MKAWLHQSVSVRRCEFKVKVSKCAALQILVQPQSVALMSGHNLRLSCYAVGKSPVQYQWFKTKDEVSYDQPYLHAKFEPEPDLT